MLTSAKLGTQRSLTKCHGASSDGPSDAGRLALKAENYARAALHTGIKGYGERDRLRGLAKREAAVTELTEASPENPDPGPSISVRDGGAE